ncbi:hypothetical protein FKP32DRAFT_841798 [Trametes sanguinea]|nr:hypothetical protein FKP32DRAFT_841798 [Trametes sanguinea]
MTVGPIAITPCCSSNEPQCFIATRTHAIADYARSFLKATRLEISRACVPAGHDHAQPTSLSHICWVSSAYSEPSVLVWQHRTAFPSTGGFYHRPPCCTVQLRFAPTGYFALTIIDDYPWQSVSMLDTRHFAYPAFLDGPCRHIPCQIMANVNNTIRGRFNVDSVGIVSTMSSLPSAFEITPPMRVRGRHPRAVTFE